MNNGSAEAKGPVSGQIRRGVCKFFNSQKGFGFVLDNKAEELGGQEVFVHFTSIQSKTGFRSLAEGEEVEYEVVTGSKGYQAANVTGPGGRPVVGDPKAGMVKNPPFMQFAPIAVPGPYGMDPYVQQHPGAIYAASPYQSHIVYVPSTHLQQQGQYGQLMPGSANGAQQYSPSQMAGQQYNRQATMMPPQGGFANAAGSFGPVGGMASTSIGNAYNPQPNQNPFGNAMGNPLGPSNGAAAGRGYQGPASSFGGFGSGLGLGAPSGREEMGNDSFPQFSSAAPGQQDQLNSNSSSNFFSGNLLYSSN